ncbi:SAF domain protein [compost metagenome]
MKILARRSITALTDIKPGEVLSNINVGLRRPGNGLPPIHLDDVLGRTAKYPLQKNTLLSWEDIS